MLLRYVMPLLFLAAPLKLLSPSGYIGGYMTDYKNPTSEAKEGRGGSQASIRLPHENFSEWYHELLMTAEIIDNRYSCQGNVRLVSLRLCNQEECL